MTVEAAQDRPRRWVRWNRNRLALLLLVVGLGSLAAAGIFFAVGVFGGSDYRGPGSAEPFGPELSYFQTPVPTAAPTPVPSGAPLAQFRIPKFGVEAPVIVLGVDEKGAMETPEGPWEVAWYDFTARPGFGSNAVFSGHVDALYTGNPGPAVFWNLKDLQEGDVIEVQLADGTLYTYAVVKRWSVEAETADVGPIVERTQKDVITLITCGGDAGTAYQQRLIIRAERVVGNVSAGGEPSAVGVP